MMAAGEYFYFYSRYVNRLHNGPQRGKAKDTGCLSPLRRSTHVTGRLENFVRSESFFHFDFMALPGPKDGGAGGAGGED